MNTPTTQAVTDAEIATLRKKHGINSNGRGIKEFTQVVSFANEVAALAQSRAQDAPVAVGEVIVFGGGNSDMKEVSWRGGRMPPPGTKLYATPAAGAGGSVGATTDWKHWCETCEGLGTIDETLGGEFFSNPKAECPDCDGKGYWIPRTAPEANPENSGSGATCGGLGSISKVGAS